MAKQIYIDENGNEQLVSGTINTAELLPIQSGSATNTKDYIDSKVGQWEYIGGLTSGGSGIDISAYNEILVIIDIVAFSGNRIFGLTCPKAIIQNTGLQFKTYESSSYYLTGKVIDNSNTLTYLEQSCVGWYTNASDHPQLIIYGR